MKGAVRTGWWTTSAFALGLLACGETTDPAQESASAGSGAGKSQPSSGGEQGNEGGSELVHGGMPAVTGGDAGSQGSDAGVASTQGGEPAAGTGGMPSGCDGQVGSSGVGGGAPGAPLEPHKSSFGNPGWPNSWFVSGCKELDAAGYCRLSTDCPAEGVTTVEEFPIGGCPGKRYKVRFRFSGLVEAKQYGSGKRDSIQNPANKLGGIWDGFHRDGEEGESDANVWQLTVHDEQGVKARHYYLNSFPADSELDGHTLLVQFEKTIVVVGGGHVSHRVHSPQCRAVDNCGAGVAASAGCAAPRALPAPDNTSMLPAQYQDAADGMITPTVLLSAYSNGSLAQPWRAQAGSLTVLAIGSTDDPVTTDYP